MQKTANWAATLVLALGAAAPLGNAWAQKESTPAAAATAPATPAFAPSIMLGGQTLRINGRGIRERLIFKVYEAALYTPSGKITAPEELYKADKPWRLRFFSLRNNDGATLGRLLTEGMQKNAPPEMKQQTMKYSLEMIEVFSSQKAVPEGHTFHIDYVPGQGTSFYIDDIQRGRTVPEKDFSPLVLGIWLGPHPAGEKLKAQLLGLAAPTTAADPDMAAMPSSPKN